MKQEIIVNGLMEGEIISLYAFCANFDKIIDFYLKNNFKKEFNQIIPDKNIILVNQSELLNKKSECSMNQIYCVLKRNKPVSFLIHLRNAIAHGNLIYREAVKAYEIIDKTITRKKHGTMEFYTAYGLYIREDILKLIALCLNKLKK